MSSDAPEDPCDGAARRYMDLRGGRMKPDDAAFRAWLAEPAHAAAFGQVCDAWYDMDQLADAPELAAMRREALARTGGAPPARALVGRRRAMTGLVACLGAGAAYTLLKPAEVQAATFTTARGERRTVRLEDGSELLLDARSSVTVRHYRSRRVAEIQHGRAMFSIAADRERPFHAFARQCCFSPADGAGSFSVDLGPDWTQLFVVTGSVLAHPSRDGDRPAGRDVRLHAREAMRIVGNGSATRRSGLDPAVELGWRQGRLAFKDETLAAMAARINDYAPVPIMIADAKTAALRLSGTFDAEDSLAFASAVSSYFGVDVKRTGGAVILGSVLPPQEGHRPGTI
nr:FecR domain-containing protein [Sphingomonas bacterium]